MTKRGGRRLERSARPAAAAAAAAACCTLGRGVSSRPPTAACWPYAAADAASVRLLLAAISCSRSTAAASTATMKERHGCTQHRSSHDRGSGALAGVGGVDGVGVVGVVGAGGVGVFVAFDGVDGVDDGIDDGVDGVGAAGVGVGSAAHTASAAASSSSAAAAARMSGGRRGGKIGATHGEATQGEASVSQTAGGGDASSERRWVAALASRPGLSRRSRASSIGDAGRPSHLVTPPLIADRL